MSLLRLGLLLIVVGIVLWATVAPALEPVDLVSVNNRQDEAYGYTPAGELVRVIAR